MKLKLVGGHGSPALESESLPDANQLENTEIVSHVEIQRIPKSSQVKGLRDMMREIPKSSQVKGLRDMMREIPEAPNGYAEVVMGDLNPDGEVLPEDTSTPDEPIKIEPIESIEGFAFSYLDKLIDIHYSQECFGDMVAARLEVGGIRPSEVHSYRCSLEQAALFTDEPLSSCFYASLEDANTSTIETSQNIENENRSIIGKLWDKIKSVFGWIADKFKKFWDRLMNNIHHAVRQLDQVDWNAINQRELSLSNKGIRFMLLGLGPNLAKNYSGKSDAGKLVKDYSTITEKCRSVMVNSGNFLKALSGLLDKGDKSVITKQFNHAYKSFIGSNNLALGATVNVAEDDQAVIPTLKLTIPESDFVNEIVGKEDNQFKFTHKTLEMIYKCIKQFHNELTQYPDVVAKKSIINQLNSVVGKFSNREDKKEILKAISAYAKLCTKGAIGQYINKCVGNVRVVAIELMKTVVMDQHNKVLK